MSEYGRLFERVSHIRAQLKAICRVRKADIYAVVEIDENKRLKDPYGTTVTRLIETNRRIEAIASVTALKAELDGMLDEWRRLEKEMERCDDA